MARDLVRYPAVVLTHGDDILFIHLVAVLAGVEQHAGLREVRPWSQVLGGGSVTQSALYRQRSVLAILRVRRRHALVFVVGEVVWNDL